MRFKTVSDDDSSITKISKRLNNGDWDYWLVARLDYLDDFDDNPSSKYHVTIYAVSPDALGAEKTAEILNELPGEIIDPRFVAVLLAEHGSAAPIWSHAGNNAAALWRLVSRESILIEGLFGFYMDRPLNALGATGWDWIAGNPLGSFAQRKETPR